MKIFIKTYGCQMNVVDSERAAGILLTAGHSMAEDEYDADIVLLNTCSVRNLAEEKVWSKLGELHNKRNGNLILGVLGCMAQQYGEKIFERAPYVNLVCGTHRFNRIGDLIIKTIAGEKIIDIEDSDDEYSNYDNIHRESKISAFVPISRGCDNFCSYCVVPNVRGREKHRTINEIMSEIQNLSQKGYKEITLLGQNVNSYKDGNSNFVDLLKAVNDIDGICRIRFVTSHPKDATVDLFNAIKNLEKVCEYLHIPAQSGSNRILGKMNRCYTREHYLDLIKKAKVIVPNISLSTDIIVGFPGETEDDFKDTHSLMEEVRYDSAFIFKYSPRPGTKAESFEDDVPIEVKKERNNCLLKLQDSISLKKNKKMTGEIVEVLVEGTSKTNSKRLTGRTRTNRIVVFEGNINLTGKLVHMRIKEAAEHSLIGELDI
jgi:tRNA-2-methylthio-N6-dimethylallyladenosine synthase